LAKQTFLKSIMGQLDQVSRITARQATLLVLRKKITRTGQSGHRYTAALWQRSRIYLR